jgi:hypothetical protein
MPATAEGLQWWEGWDLCDACRHHEHSALAEEHWNHRRNKDDDYEPGAKEADYSCLDCWKTLVVPSQWNTFGREWRHQLAPSDWANIVNWKEFIVDTVHPTQRVGKWCCREAREEGENHNPFYCRMAESLETGKERKIDVENGRQHDPLWVRPRPYVPLGDDPCVVS